MIFKIAWKNIWRNKLRSGVVIGAIAFGLIGAIFIGALTVGMMSDMTQSMINDRIGHIQIHNPSYPLNNEIEFRFDERKINKTLQNDSRIEGYSSRISLDAIAQTAISSRGITLTGVDPEAENSVTFIKSKLIEGSYFESGDQRAIVIGQKLADTLNLKLGSKIISTLADINGQVVSMNFKIKGIYKTNNITNDLTNVYVDIKKLRSIISFQSFESNEIAIRLNDMNEIESVQNDLKGKFIDLEIRSWSEVEPAIAASAASMDVYLFVIVAIVLLALAFGIINTMLMAILERSKEICMLRACGMKKWNVMSMIVLETIFMTMLGGFIGNVISFIIISITGAHGITFKSFEEGFSSMGISATIHPQIEPINYLYFTLLVFLTATISSIFPTRRALKMNVAKTINSH